MSDVHKMVIGSAQFGMAYGIANKSGQIHENEITKILDLAKSKQINYIDTAAQYGESENILGRLASNHFKIITKVASLPQNCSDAKSYVKNQCFSSLKNLRRDCCEALLIHQANDLLGPQGKDLYQGLVELKSENKIKKIGVSVYSPEQVKTVMQHFSLDIIQFPVNILDQRFLENNFLQTLKDKNIELHARSLFLQGLLLMNLEKMPAYFNSVKFLLQQLIATCHMVGFTLRQALIEFVTTIKVVDHFIFGVDDVTHLSEIIADFSVIQIKKSNISYYDYKCNDLNIINPSHWKLS